MLCVVSTLVFGAPNIYCELLRDNRPINVKLHRCMMYATVTGSAVLFLFLNGLHHGRFTSMQLYASD